MIKIILLFISLFLLIIWLVYRETHQRKKTKAWAKSRIKKNNIPYQNAINNLRQNTNQEKPIQSSSEVSNSLNTEPPEYLREFKLIRPGMIDEETFATASNITDAIKRPHPALQTITRNITTDELIDVLHGCPDITAKILTTVNSAAFGLAQPITSVNHALIYLGSSIVKSIATQFIIKQSMVSQSKSQQNAFNKLWSAAYLTSSLAFLTAQSLSKINAAELSTKSLLNTVGCFAMTSFDEKLAPLYIEKSSLLERIETEQKTYGLNTSIVGNLLAKKWKLPQSMIEAITYSYFPLRYNKETQSFTDQEKHDLVFCYFMCRLGELFCYEKLNTIEEFNLDEQTEFEFFYMQEALEDTQLTSCLEILKNPTYINKANKIIKQSKTY